MDAHKRNNNLLIAGDFNYKNIDWEHQYAVTGQKHLIDFIESIQDCFLYQHITEPTRYRENEPPNLLDLILTSEEGMIRNLTYHPPLGESDHIVIRFELINSEQKQPYRPTRNVFKTDYTAVKKTLSAYHWQSILNSDFKNDYRIFVDFLTSELEKYTPLTTPPKKKKSIYMTLAAIRLEK